MTVKVWPATVNVPVRAGPVLAATVKPALPLPEPLAPLVTVIQLALLVAVQAQPAPLVTFTVPVPPAATKSCELGAILKVQPFAWLTVKICPAMLSVPVRAGPVLAAAVKATAPLPLPLAPEVIVSQFALLVAVQRQPPGEVTVTVPVPPAAATFCDVGAMLYEQAATVKD